VWEYNSKTALLFNKRPEEIIGKSFTFSGSDKNTIPQSVLQPMKTKKEIIIEDYFTPGSAGSENRVIPSKQTQFYSRYNGTKLAERLQRIKHKREIRKRII
jgi:hypothetical protein